MDTLAENLKKADARTRKVYKRAITKRGRKSNEELAVIQQITGKAFLPKAPKAAAKTVKRSYTKQNAANAALSLDSFIKSFDAAAPLTVSQGKRQMVLQNDAAHAAIIGAHGVIKSRQDIQDKLADILGN